MKTWKQYCETNNVGSLKRGGYFSSKLSVDDLELIETLKLIKEICESKSGTLGTTICCLRFHEQSKIGYYQENYFRGRKKPACNRKIYIK